jgi:hypothetical protein
MDYMGMKEKVDVIKSSIFDDTPKLLKAVWPELQEIVEQIDRIEQNQKRIEGKLDALLGEEWEFDSPIPGVSVMKKRSK